MRVRGNRTARRLREEWCRAAQLTCPHGNPLTLVPFELHTRHVMAHGLTLLSGNDPSPHAERLHAMKNCVSVIIALFRLVERDAAGVGEERWTHLQCAAHCLQELLAEDLAEGTGERAVEPRVWCGVEALVSSVTGRLKARMEEAEIQLTVDCGGGAIKAEEASLSEALFNLMANAIEATPRGGLVTRETRQLRNGDQQWILRDCGPGIPHEQLAQMGNRQRSQKVGGSGLGVALARAAIARHGGLLRVESGTPGSGTAIAIGLVKEFDGCEA